VAAGVFEGLPLPETLPPLLRPLATRCEELQALLHHSRVSAQLHPLQFFAASLHLRVEAGVHQPHLLLGQSQRRQISPESLATSVLWLPARRQS